MKAILFLLMLAASCSKTQDEDKRSEQTKQEYSIIESPNGTRYHTGLRKSPAGTKKLGETFIRLTDCGVLPDKFDLRELGLVAGVRNQGNCGSCWAFSKTGSLESALLGAGVKLDLSEQELVSCDSEQYGCGGGNLSNFSYQINHGQSLEKDYPYTSGNSGRNGSCKSSSKAANGVSFKYVGSAEDGPNEEELKCALYTYKTVPWITVSATNAWGSPPSSEKSAYNRCGRGQTNHAVGVVGWWKDSKGKTQFIMKNSWGKGWGDQGYMSLPLGCDSFGEEVAFIEVEKKPDPSPTPTPPGPQPTPTPGPCSAAKNKLPAEVQVLNGVEIMLGIKPEVGVSYVWTEAGVTAGTGSMLYVAPTKDSVYKLTATNACSVVESQVRVRIVMSAN